jgi:hypothetical protein
MRHPKLLQPKPVSETSSAPILRRSKFAAIIIIWMRRQMRGFS